MEEIVDVTAIEDEPVKTPIGPVCFKCAEYKKGGTR